MKRILPVVMGILLLTSCQKIIPSEPEPPQNPSKPTALFIGRVSLPQMHYWAAYGRFSEGMEIDVGFMAETLSAFFWADSLSYAKWLDGDTTAVLRDLTTDVPIVEKTITIPSTGVYYIVAVNYRDTTKVSIRIIRR